MAISCVQGSRRRGEPGPKPARVLRRDRRAVAALEFGLVAPVFIMMLLGLMDVMYALTVELAVTDGVQEASRLGSLGATPTSGTTREAAISNMVIAKGAGLLQAAALTVTEQTFGSGSAYDYAHQTTSTISASGAGGSHQLVQYNISYVQPLLTPFGMAFNGGTTVTHRAVIVVQNEPF